MQDLKQNRSATTVSLRQVPLVIRVATGDKVTVTGEFTAWSKEGIAMKPMGKGRFRTMLNLAPGKYQYRLIVDGKWTNDLDTEERIGNPFGTENSVLVVE